MTTQFILAGILMIGVLIYLVYTLFFLQLIQGYLPLNPQNLGATSWPLAFNTAMSFTTNTNWQSYAGETTLSYLSQMLGLTSHNFLSAATGMAALLTLTRGLVRKTVDTVGNFWVDLVRMVVYILLPLSIIMAILLVGEGVIQTFSPYVEVTTLENAKQTIPLGPVASQIAIKQLGTNGGGFFNTNSAHPFENPTAFSNLLEMLALVLIPAASVYTFGIMIGSKKHAWLLFSAMFIFWAAGIFISFSSEHLYNPVIDVYPILEGKETRLGVTNSLLWSVSTTGTSNGSVNAMMSSLSPLPSGGSNLGPTSAALKKAVEERQEKILKAHSVDKDKIPAELLFASGSGLDPHISVATAYFQIERVAKSRGVESKNIKSLVDTMTIKRGLGFLGEACVNVLMLNQALDELLQKLR